MRFLTKILARSDEGSGTLLGAVLILLVGLAAFCAVCAGSFLTCRAEAQSLAESTASDLAYTLQIEGSSSVCEQARERFSSGQFMLDSCVVDGEDVQVSIRGIPRLSFLPQVRETARAGPVDCVSRNG
ncbi:Rv3654c family TadE-like protein [Alloscardovia macacae]|nr:Rv3654c family TadE-like protein [Alloscardovia macacae]